MLLHTMLVPLLLLTALLDVSTTCPLNLQYPDLVELGEEMLVNCATFFDGYLGIFLSYGNETKEFTPNSELSIPHVDLDTQAKCTIIVNDTDKCSEDLLLNVFKAVQSYETAQENNLLEFKCDIPSVASVRNLTVTWYMRNQIMKTTFFNNSTSAAGNMHSSLEKNVSREDNGATITCEVRMDLGPHGHVFISNKTWNLSVQYAPELNKNVDILPLNSTEATDNETITATPAAPEKPRCPVRITPSKIIVKYNKRASANCSTTEEHDGMGWEATVGGKSLTMNVANLEWTAEHVDWTTTAACFINPINGPQCNESLDITVYDIPDTVQVSPVGNDPLVEDKPHKLKCKFFNVAPREKLQVKWYREDMPIHTEMFNESATFTFIPKKEDNKANFTCELELLLGEKEQNPIVMSEPYVANVQYQPSVQDCPTDFAGKEDEFKLETMPCKANGNPPPDVYWYYKGNPVNSTTPLTRNEAGTYTARFENGIGNISTNVEITIEYAPLFTCGDHYNVIENAHLESPCEPEGIPKPKYAWFKDDTKVDFPKLWKRHDGGQYFIEANNKHGQAKHTLSINVLYAPSLSEDITQEFHMAENLTLNCSADGNPPPELHWKYPPAANANTTTRGRQIYITEATSTNAGLYVCNATNEIGSVTRTVTLIMKGTTHINYNMVSIFVLIAILFAILVCVLIYRSYKRKSGHYVISPYDSVPLTSRP